MPEELFSFNVRNSQEVWDVLNGRASSISHTVENERNDQMTLEFSDRDDHNQMVDVLREELGAQAFPDGQWPQYIQE